jgi:hypothetical protein
MALSQPVLKQRLLAFFSQTRQSEMSEEGYADNLATIITDYIKTATVKPGIPVATTGGAAAQSGSTTGPGELV